MMEFFSEQPLYSVLVIVLICWGGIMGYLLRLGKKVSLLSHNSPLSPEPGQRVTEGA